MTDHENTSVAEIGCGRCALGSLLSAESDISYVGYDLSDSSKLIGKRNNIDIRQEYFSGSGQESMLDFVIMDNVLEHVLEPRDLIQEAFLSLKKDGYLLIVVPFVGDVRQYISTKFRNNDHWDPGAHINYFSPKDLSMLTSQFSKSGAFGQLKININLSWSWKIKLLLEQYIQLTGIYFYAKK